MTLEDKVQSIRLHALRRAQQLGNVSAACRELGISRTVFYRWRSQLASYGVDGLAFIRSVGRSVRDGLTRSACRMSRRFWPWLLDIRLAAPSIMRICWVSRAARCPPVRSIGRYVA